MRFLFACLLGYFAVVLFLLSSLVVVWLLVYLLIYSFTVTGSFIGQEFANLAKLTGH